jgi:D-beta-D-heptose 7-phosphate kinase/D-beta-D-heptose 1-phosphate adenosyltransferase
MTDLENIPQPTKYKILLIGDSCIDEYYYGTCDRLNPEAPVPVLKITRSSTSLGMAANVKSNLESFGCDIDFMTGGKKSIKRRYIDERSKQHIVRVDEDYNSTPFNPYQSSLAFIQYDAIVISDYNKGFITYDNIQAIREQYNGPIFIDSKKNDLIRFEGCYMKINENEYKQTISQCSNLIVTLGERGAQYKDKLYPTQKVEVVDVCGAGDTFLAALSYYYLKNNRSIESAIIYANKCSAIAVQHRGVYSLTKQDIDVIENDRH